MQFCRLRSAALRCYRTLRLLSASRLVPRLRALLAQRSQFEVMCEPGDRVIQQGEIGDVLYVVESGKFNAFLRAKGDDEPVMSYASGDLFGEVQRSGRLEPSSRCGFAPAN